MTLKLLGGGFLIFVTTLFSFGQQVDKDRLLWSATHKLTVDDFGIKTKQFETSSSFAQFSVDFQVNGFDFLTKNFNKKVRNYFLKTASWIDTSGNIQESLIYQQTLFDLCEIYTRQFRKALRDNRLQLAKGTQIAEDLNNQIMAAFAKRRITYDRETSFGTNPLKQKEWEIQIRTELKDLKDFAYE